MSSTKTVTETHETETVAGEKKSSKGLLYGLLGLLAAAILVTVIVLLTRKCDPNKCTFPSTCIGKKCQLKWQYVGCFSEPSFDSNKLNANKGVPLSLDATTFPDLSSALVEAQNQFPNATDFAAAKLKTPSQWWIFALNGIDASKANPAGSKCVLSAYNYSIGCIPVTGDTECTSKYYAVYALKIK